jgi:hypothetical protein
LLVQTSTHAFAVAQYVCVEPVQPQLPRLHTSVAWHLVPQLPQLAVLLEVSTHLPSAAQNF